MTDHERSDLAHRINSLESKVETLTVHIMTVLERDVAQSTDIATLKAMSRQEGADAGRYEGKRMATIGTVIAMIVAAITTGVAQGILEALK